MENTSEIEVGRGLEHEIAIVTGAGRGVGLAIALELARQGAAVAAAGRSRVDLEAAETEIVRRGGRAVAVPTDVTDADEVVALIREVESMLGAPTLLVNNAGSLEHVGPVAEADPAEWWRDVEVNLKGTFLCTRAVLPAMLAQRAGRIVNLSSYAAIAPSPYMTAYASAKAAVLRFTDSLAAELEATGVRVFCVTPGFVRTQLVEQAGGSERGRRFLPHLSARADALEPERAARLVGEIACGRLDPLSGRFLHVLDDLDDLLRRSDEIAEHDLYALRLRTSAP